LFVKEKGVDDWCKLFPHLEREVVERAVYKYSDHDEHPVRVAVNARIQGGLMARQMGVYRG